MKRSSTRDENGSVSPDEPILVADPLRLMPSRAEAFVGERRVGLNYVECQILRILIEQRPHVVTRTELMTAAWGVAPPERRALIDEFVTALKKKLGDEVAIKAFPGIGYCLE